MKKIRFVAILGVALSFFSAVAANETMVPADRAKFPVVLLMGQSNMEGAGYPVLPEYVRGTPNVLALNGDLKWEVAKVPLGRGMGPGFVFARHYALLHPGTKIGYVQTAVGGRSLKQLSPGGPLYAKAIERAKAAMESGPLIAVLWHQGESDAGNADYPRQLAAFVAQLRKDLGIEKVPFIAGEIGHFDREGVAKFNENLAKVPALIPNSAVVSAKGLRDRGDELHFLGFADEIFGCRYLMKYLEMREPGLAARFRPELARVTAEMTRRDEEMTTFVNPSMTEGEARPFGWDAKGPANGPLSLSRDTRVYASAPASLRVESDRPARDFVGMRLRGVKGRTIRVTARIRNEGFDQCALRLTGRRPASKPGMNEVVIDATKAATWTKFSGEIVVPPEVTAVALEFFVVGQGKAWLDDVAVEKAGP